ncbi:flagellin [Litoreibacter albidus]|uniref:flagellin n=1 Tax=Litoreibacter albidus TaxID=670155 RepID=UPI00373605BC
MNYSSISDLGQSMMLRRRGAGLKTTLAHLTNELTTGERSDLSGHVRGEFGPLAGLERSLRRLDGFAFGRESVDLRVTGIQTSLEAMQGAISTFGTDMLAAASLEQSDVLDAKLASAASRLSQVTAYLNTQLSGEFLFSGVATRQQPLPDGATILSHVRSIASGSSGPADFMTQIDAWFGDAGGGFETLVYGGDAVAQSGIALSDTLSVGLPFKADDAAFRATLKNLAIAAVISEGGVAVTAAEKRSLVSDAGLAMIAAEKALIDMQRDTGVTQGLIVEASIAGGVERAVLEEAKSKITGVDQYEAASALEAVQFQVEALYVLTARTSQLRLMDYLR